MRIAQRKWSRPLALVGVVAAVLVLASTALAAGVIALLSFIQNYLEEATDTHLLPK